MSREIKDLLIKSRDEIKELFPFYRITCNTQLQNMFGIVDQDTYDSKCAEFRVEYERIKSIISELNDAINKFDNPELLS